VIATGTFAAISLGVLLGGLIATHEDIWYIAGPLMFLIAYMGYRATLAFPSVERGSPDLKLDANLFRQALKGIEFARTDRPIWVCMLGLSWFWALSSIVLTQIPAFTRYVLGGDITAVTALITVFIVGLALGAFLSTRTDGSRTEPGLIPIALIGMIAACAALAIDPAITERMQSLKAIMFQRSGQQAAIGILLFGIFGGLYLVPQYSLIQQRTNLGSRARVIAANNLLNALFVITASLSGLILLGFMHWSIKAFFALYCLLSVPVLAFQYRHFGQEFWRLVGFAIGRSFYRIRVEGKANIPESGAALLVCNHLSYADAVVLFGTIDRRCRFVMEDIYHRIPILNWAFRGARTIPISSPLKNRKTFEDAENSAVEALQNGELVFIFPEGRLSPQGEMIPFKRGVMRILERQPVPVIPIAISGLWGSFFSHGGKNAALKGLPRLRWKRRKVCVFFGEQLVQDEISLGRLEQAVQSLYQKGEA